jgi:hypothetical protein
MVLVTVWIENAWLVLPSLQEWSGTAFHTVLALAVMLIATAAFGLLLVPRWGVQPTAQTTPREESAA